MHRAPTKSTTSPLAPLLVGEGNRVRRQLLYCTIHPFSFQEKVVGMSSFIIT